MTTLDARISKTNDKVYKKQLQSEKITEDLIRTINNCEKECLSDENCMRCDFASYGKNCYSAKLAMKIRKSFSVRGKYEQSEKR